MQIKIKLTLMSLIFMSTCLIKGDCQLPLDSSTSQSESNQLSLLSACVLVGKNLLSMRNGKNLALKSAIFNGQYKIARFWLEHDADLLDAFDKDEFGDFPCHETSCGWVEMGIDYSDNGEVVLKITHDPKVKINDPAALFEIVKDYGITRVETCIASDTAN